MSVRFSRMYELAETREMMVTSMFFLQWGDMRVAKEVVCIVRRDGRKVLHIASAYCFAGRRGGPMTMAFGSIQNLFK